MAHGEIPDLVVGSSVGALNAAYLAGEPTLQGVERLESVWRGLRRRDIFQLAWLGSVLGLFGWRDHLIESGGLRRLIERHLRYRRLEDAFLPCHVVATDVVDGSEVCLSSGPAVAALLASTAIPGVFPVVQIGQRHLVDGGVASNTPIATAVSLGARRLIVLATGFSCAIERPPHGAVALAIHALNLLVARQLVLDARRFADIADLIVVPPLCPPVSSYDFSRIGEMIDRATAQTECWLSAGGLEVDDDPALFEESRPTALQPRS